VVSPQQRTRLALLRLGPATISSALTTLCTTVFLANCVVGIFVRFGIVLFVITVQGVLAALIVEPAFLSAAGEVNLRGLCRRREKQSDTFERQRTTTSPVEEERESDLASAPRASPDLRGDFINGDQVQPVKQNSQNSHEGQPVKQISQNSRDF